MTRPRPIIYLPTKEARSALADTLYNKGMITHEKAFLDHYIAKQSLSHSWMGWVSPAMGIFFCTGDAHWQFASNTLFNLSPDPLVPLTVTFTRVNSPRHFVAYVMELIQANDV